jgi:TPR repeat protein
MPSIRSLAAFIVLTSTFLVAAGAGPLQDATEALQRKDYATAARLLEPLARDGDAQAQVRLALLYYHGQGVREDNTLALQWFDRAARQGLAEAQYHLGNMYAYGLAGLPADVDGARLAAQWYFEAARQGHAEAQYGLGILFLTGSGVEQNAAEAQRWIERAAAQGHPDAAAYLKGKAR